MAAKTKAPTNARSITIAYIGGGSRGWAHTLMADAVRCKHLTGEIRLYDIDRPMAMVNARWGRRLNESPDARTQWRYTVPKTLAETLKGADFVVASIQPGPIEMMGSDLNIPKKYGLLHTVGDTAGPAGLVRALRSAPEYATIAKAVARYCPHAWVINYTNPMTVCTRTLYKVFPEIKAFGCCHEVFGTQGMLVKLLKKIHGIKATRQDIRTNVLGVNHFTWIDKAWYKDIDLLEMYAKHWRAKGMVKRFSEDEMADMDFFSHKNQVTFDLFKRFGILPAAGERHLVEFLPNYIREERTLHSFGVKCTPYSFRIGRYLDLPEKFRKRLRDKKPFKIKASNEEAIDQIMAILGLGDMHTNVNLPNVGQLKGLPAGAVVESNAYFTEDSVKPEFAGRLPAGVETIVQRASANIEMIVEAALTCDKDLAFQAILNDPLTMLSTDKAWKMFNEMLKATKAMLPGW